MRLFASMKNIDQTRRRFMTTFAATSLGTTLVPGVLWARMQDAGASKVTLAMVTDALKLSGIDLPEDEKNNIVDAANRNLTSVEAIRKVHIPNDVSPPFHVSSIRLPRSRSPGPEIVPVASRSPVRRLPPFEVRCAICCATFQ